MKIISTLYETYDMEWRIHVNPKGLKNDSPDDHRPIITFWTPNGEPQNRMLLYNPKIALVGRVKRNPTEENIYIPLNMLYAFANRLSSVYQGLSTEGLKKRDGNHLYIDQNHAMKLSQKLTLFSKSVVMVPSVLTIHDTEVIGIQFTVGGKFAGSMPHTDIRELCEILTHTDIQVYALILSLMETIDTMDQKIDRVLEMQSEILGLLRSNGDNKVKMTMPAPMQSAGLQWERLS